MFAVIWYETNLSKRATLREYHVAAEREVGCKLIGLFFTDLDEVLIEELAIFRKIRTANHRYSVINVVASCQIRSEGSSHK